MYFLLTFVGNGGYGGHVTDGKRTGEGSAEIGKDPQGEIQTLDAVGKALGTWRC